MNDIELTNSATDIMVYGTVLMLGMAVALVALHLYVLPALKEGYYKVAKALYWGLRKNHEATGGTGYLRKH